MKGEVLLLDTVHPILQDMLEAMGYRCTSELEAEAAQLLNIVHRFAGIVVRGRVRLDATLLEKAVNLRFIARAGSGLENIDIPTAQRLGITVVNSPEGNRDAVAEHVIGMLLMLFNKLHKADREVRAGIWDREGNRGIELKGKTVGIIGYGYMGAALAQRLAGFGVTLIAYDKYKKNFGTDTLREATLSDIFSAADIISFHVPLTPETKYYFQEEFLSHFSNPIYLVNTSRGAIASLPAIAEGIRKGKILGACLDVLDTESHNYTANFKSPSADLQYLLQSDKVVFSPHVAGWTVESYRKLSEILGQKLMDAGLEKQS